LANNYQGSMPQHTSYGYSGQAYQRNSNMRLAMAAGAGLVGGLALGVGGYYVYNRLSEGNWGGNWQDRSWCKTPGGRQMLCVDCNRAYGSACLNENSCYGSTGCSWRTPRNVQRDDIMGAGFVPADWRFPIKIKITAITGTSFSTAAVCPVAQPVADGSNPAWQSASSFEVGLFLTLTEMDDIGYTGRPSADIAWAGQLPSPLILFLAMALAWRRII
jgi:hypothetical protein